jgi:regulator of sigma E protease
MARRNGVDVEEFGIGFPPRAWVRRIKSKKGDFDFTFNWLPLGGFVRLKGEHDADKEPGTFGAAKLPAKVKIMVAGVVVNLLVAFLLLMVVAIMGMPKLVPNQYDVPSDAKTVREDTLIGYIEPGSPAQNAGLQEMDKVVAITDSSGQAVDFKNAERFPDATQQLAGQTAMITYQRDGETKTVPVTLRGQEEVSQSQKTDSCTGETYNEKGYLGITPSQVTVDRYTWSAPVVAAGTTAQFTQMTFAGLGNAVKSVFTGKACEASRQVAGPVGIFVILQDSSSYGFQFLLLVIAIISLTLAIMNILPIPALDGGRLFVTLIFHGLRKPLSKKTEDIIHGTGFALLMVLFLLITVIDVRRFF